MLAVVRRSAYIRKVSYTARVPIECRGAILCGAYDCTYVVCYNIRGVFNMASWMSCVLTLIQERRRERERDRERKLFRLNTDKESIFEWCAYFSVDFSNKISQIFVRFLFLNWNQISN